MEGGKKPQRQILDYNIPSPIKIQVKKMFEVPFIFQISIGFKIVSVLGSESSSDLRKKIKEIFSVEVSQVDGPWL